MTVKLLPPDVRRILDDLARRIGILERRVTPAAATGHTHDGTGSDSTIVSGDTALPPTASGADGTAVGVAAEAIQDESVAVGPSATAASVGSGLDRGGVAIGYNSHSQGYNAVALGAGSVADADSAVAIGGQTIFGTTVVLGSGASATAANQIQLGTSSERTIQGVPNSAIPDANLAINQMSFYLNEAGNLLVVKVKYSGGTVKTGSIALV